MRDNRQKLTCYMPSSADCYKANKGCPVHEDEYNGEMTMRMMRSYDEITRDFVIDYQVNTMNRGELLKVYHMSISCLSILASLIGFGMIRHCVAMFYSHTFMNFIRTP